MNWFDQSIVRIYIQRQMIKVGILGPAILKDLLKLNNIKTAWPQILPLVEWTAYLKDE